jgi:hypothetical protein
MKIWYFALKGAVSAAHVSARNVLSDDGPLKYTKTTSYSYQQLADEDKSEEEERSYRLLCFTLR